jgi:MFS family permease
VLLPLLADFVWHGSASTYALLTAAMGVGSVGGALAAGARGRVSGGLLVIAAALFGVFLAMAAVAPTLELQVLALVPLGAASVTFAAGVNSILQIRVEPLMRGRVMALYSIVFLGSTPIGAPLVGWLAEVGGPRAGLWAGAVACFVAAVGAGVAFRRVGEYRRSGDDADLEPTGDGSPQPRRGGGRAPRPQGAGALRLDRS